VRTKWAFEDCPQVSLVPPPSLCVWAPRVHDQACIVPFYYSTIFINLQYAPTSFYRKNQLMLSKFTQKTFDVQIGGPVHNHLPSTDHVAWRCMSPFVWLISYIFSVNEYYFSLIINQSTVLSTIIRQTNRAWTVHIPARCAPCNGRGGGGHEAHMQDWHHEPNPSPLASRAHHTTSLPHCHWHTEDRESAGDPDGQTRPGERHGHQTSRERPGPIRRAHDTRMLLGFGV